MPERRGTKLSAAKIRAWVAGDDLRREPVQLVSSALEFVVSRHQDGAAQQDGQASPADCV